MGGGYFCHLAVARQKQAVSATLSWLMIIYLVPLIGVIAYLIFGEVKLGARRAKAFQLLKPKYIKWLNLLSEQKDVVTHSKDPRYRALFKLVHQRLGIPNIRGNELHILDTPKPLFEVSSVIFNKLAIPLIWSFIFGVMMG